MLQIEEDEAELACDGCPLPMVVRRLDGSRDLLPGKCQSASPSASCTTYAPVSASSEDRLVRIMVPVHSSGPIDAAPGSRESRQMWMDGVMSRSGRHLAPGGASY